MIIRRLVRGVSRVSAIMEGVSNPKVVFVLGGPGAGKGTQCSKIVDKYNFVHLSAGDLLRAERNTPGTVYGDLIESHIRNGTIVPVEITCKLIERAMRESGRTNFLIDGFPRNKDNLEGWQREMEDKAELLFVLFFKCSEDVCIERCLKRGAEGSGRSDDNHECLRKRIQTFLNDTMPIVNYYQQHDLVKSVDADKNEDDVFADIKTIFDGFM
ncbi:UMP-CMP kinase [Cimex lectularius]|uniref:UMP-CMP kinase n=1 Tax=Cimex lectularius TaxID=79782 RepID=A0A8I6RI78_CIMLE|nr:UMP-CMP kinase [Cimex lectularius]